VIFLNLDLEFEENCIGIKIMNIEKPQDQFGQRLKGKKRKKTYSWTKIDSKEKKRKNIGFFKKKKTKTKEFFLLSFSSSPFSLTGFI